MRGTLEQLQSEYGDKIRIVYKNLIVHPQSATTPALAACAAHEQGKFEAMRKIIWDKAYQTREFSQGHMEKLGAELGLDVDQLRMDMIGSCVKRLRNDQAMLAKFGARGTPAFFINGRFLSGARPIDQFKVLIDEELAKANTRMRKGRGRTRLRDYYDTWVIGKGKPSL